MVYLHFTSVSVCSLDQPNGTFFVFAIWQALSLKLIFCSARPMIRLYGTHRIVILAVRYTVFPPLVDEDMVELCSFSIGICMCPKLTVLFLERCTYTHQFTLLCQIQKQTTVSIRFIMKTETNYMLRSYLSVHISNNDDDIMFRKWTYDIL